jgi:hypothetical protein
MLIGECTCDDCKRRRGLLERPKPPCMRLIMDHSCSGICPKCGSSLQRRIGWLGHIFGIGKVLGCIQPECENYYLRSNK